MKKLFLMLLAVGSWQLAAMAQKPAVVKGKITGYKPTAHLLFMKELSHADPDTIKVNANGEYTLTRNITKPEENVLIYNTGDKQNGIVYIYSMPGETLTIDMAPTEQEKDYWGGKYIDVKANPTYKGKAAQECKYLNIEKKYEFGGKDAQGNLRSFKDYCKDVTAYVDEHRKALEGTSEKFKAEKTAELPTMETTGKLSFFYGDEKYNFLNDPDFAAYVKSINLNDTANCHGEGFYCYGSTAYLVVAGVTECDSTYLPGKSRSYRFLSYVKDNIQNQTVRNRLGNLAFYLSIQKATPELFDVYSAVVSHDTLYDSYAAQYKTINSLKPGVEASDFEMYDRNDKKLTFHDVIKKGKVTYIDFWATWCGPCCAEIPFVEKLVEKFKGDDRIQFVSISLDNNIQAWKKKLAKDKPTWQQYVVPDNFNSKFAKDYQINGIPRFMIFDGEGRIINIDASRPSDEKTEGYIRSFLK